jgi:hypothetical protein
MEKDFAAHLRQTVEQAAAELRRIGEDRAATPGAGGEWSRKEELGHLLDSATNNHQRFARAALDGEYRGPGYEQDRWVSLHGYRELPWTLLVDLWQRHNWMLAHLVARIPPERLEAQCIIGDRPPVTLRYVVEDYVAHLKHHLERIMR